MYCYLQRGTRANIDSQTKWRVQKGSCRKPLALRNDGRLSDANRVPQNGKKWNLRTKGPWLPKEVKVEAKYQTHLEKFIDVTTEFRSICNGHSGHIRVARIAKNYQQTKMGWYTGPHTKQVRGHASLKKWRRKRCWKWKYWNRSKWNWIHTSYSSQRRTKIYAYASIIE